MMRWALAAIIGLMIAALHYRGLLRTNRWLAVLRALGAALVAAIILGAPAAPGRPSRPLVVLDVSASWRRGGDAGSRWREALDSARRIGGDSLLLAGDSLRAAGPSDSTPGDVASSIADAADRARTAGRSLVLFTDGGATGAAGLPAASRVRVLGRTVGRDLAIAALDVPEQSSAGDTIEARVTLRAGEAGSSATELDVGFVGSAAPTVNVPPLAPRAERVERVTVVVAPGRESRVLRAVLRGGDGEPRNDTLVAVHTVGAANAAVVVSTAPDPDARDALEALAGALPQRPRGFYRLAPDLWREAATLAPVRLDDVRAAARTAPLLVIQGDTSVLGTPMTATSGSLVFMLSGSVDEPREWRAAAGGASPLSLSLAAAQWDSLPPIAPAATPPSGEWVAMSATVGSGVSRPIVAGSERGGRRVATVAASGLWRWRSRGGAARDTYLALWGALADWALAERASADAIAPAIRTVREGEPITWRRSGIDSLFTVTLDGGAQPRTLQLGFAAGARSVVTPAPPAGLYTLGGAGRGQIAVNRSDEWVPPLSTLRDTTIGGDAPRTPSPSLRDAWWAFALAIAIFCGEWLLRRRAGLR